MKSVAIPENGSAARVPNRSRRWPWIAIPIAVAAIIAITLYWLPPKHHSAARAGTCWDSLVPSGLIPSISGPGITTTSATLSTGWATGGGAATLCEIDWSDQKHGRLQANVGQDVNDSFATDLELASHNGKPMQSLDFGEGADGFVNGYDAELIVSCKPKTSSTPSLGTITPHLYIGVGLTSGTYVQDRESQQGFVDAAFKLAKAAALQVPCTNAIHFSAQAPTVH